MKVSSGASRRIRLPEDWTGETRLELNTPLTRKRSRAEAELPLNAEGDDSDDEVDTTLHRNAVIDARDGDYLEVEAEGRRSESGDRSSMGAQSE